MSRKTFCTDEIKSANHYEKEGILKRDYNRRIRERLACTLDSTSTITVKDTERKMKWNQGQRF